MFLISGRENWVGFLNKKWEEWECRKLLSLKMNNNESNAEFDKHEFLNRCMRVCEQEEGCTAYFYDFNLRGDGIDKCDLLQCPLPVIQPKANIWGSAGLTFYRIGMINP